MKNFFDDKLKFLSAIALAALSFFLFTRSFVDVADVRIRAKSPHPNVITFRGISEIEAKPDVATFEITIRENDKNVTQAQQKMTQKNNKLLEILEQKSIKKDDIKTTNYSTNPRYVYESRECRKGICLPAKQVLQDYEATQTLSVKLRDIEKCGEILGAIASLEIGEVNGPSFAIDDLSKLKSEAQAQAIKKAQIEAKNTAKNLGVSLGKIVRFAEEPNNNFARPMMMGRAVASDMAVKSVQIEPGVDKVVSVVSITYEID